MTGQTIDLAAVIRALAQKFPAVSHVYLFGSRLHRTTSVRSDIDILLIADEHIKPSEIREFTWETCPALDVFVLQGNRAVSCINESFIEADGPDQILQILQARVLWTRTHFTMDADIDWQPQVAYGVTFPFTALPDLNIMDAARAQLLRLAESADLPTQPYLGDDGMDVALFLIEVMRRMILKASDLGKRGQAKDGWTVDLRSEYDFQNLF